MNPKGEEKKEKKKYLHSTCTVPGCESRARPLFCYAHGCRLDFCLQQAVPKERLPGKYYSYCAGHKDISIERVKELNKIVRAQYNSEVKHTKRLSAAERRADREAFLRKYLESVVPAAPAPAAPAAPAPAAPAPAPAAPDAPAPAAPAPVHQPAPAMEFDEDMTDIPLSEQPPLEPTWYPNLRDDEKNDGNNIFAFPAVPGYFEEIRLEMDSMVDPTERSVEPLEELLQMNEVDWDSIDEPPFSYIHPLSKQIVTYDFKYFQNRDYEPPANPPLMEGREAYKIIFDLAKSRYEAGKITADGFIKEFKRSLFLVPPWTSGKGLRGNYPRYVNSKSLFNPLGCSHPMNMTNNCLIRKVPTTFAELIAYNCDGKVMDDWPCLSPLMNTVSDKFTAEHLMSKIIMVPVCFGNLPNHQSKGWSRPLGDMDHPPPGDHCNPRGRVDSFVARVAVTVQPYALDAKHQLDLTSIKKRNRNRISKSCHCKPTVYRDDTSGRYPLNPFKRYKHRYVHVGPRGKDCKDCAPYQAATKADLGACAGEQSLRIEHKRYIDWQWREAYIAKENAKITARNTKRGTIRFKPNNKDAKARNLGASAYEDIRRYQEIRNKYLDARKRQLDEI